MKVVILTDQIAESWGGAVGVAYQHAVGLARRGHAVTVIASTGTLPAGCGVMLQTIAASFPDRLAAYLGLHNPAAVRQVRAILADVKPDVAHAHNIYGALSYRSLSEAQRFSPRVFLTAHDVMSFAYAKLTHCIDPRDLSSPTRPNYHTSWRVNLRTARKRFNPLRNRIIRRRLGAMTQVFAVSQALADALHDNGISNVTVLHNGIDALAWQQPPVETLDRFRQRYHIAGKKIILFCGRIAGTKGINQILGALARVVKTIPSAMLVIAGDAEGGLSRYQPQPQQYGVAENVCFTGRLQSAEMVAAYFVSDVVVVPSICFDSFPSVNLEAMAAGKPVVATCFGGSREAVVDGQTGYIVNPYDAEMLANRITTLLSDADLATRFGRAGRERAEQKFSAEHWLNAMEVWYGR